LITWERKKLKLCGWDWSEIGEWMNELNWKFEIEEERENKGFNKGSRKMIKLIN
jgi:hypothetical protein